MKTINNVVRYNADDVAALVEEEKTQQASAEAMRAATAMAAQAQQAAERMFELTHTANEKLFALMQTSVDRANEQNVKLQEKMLKMQEDAETARTQEHLRQLATQEAQSIQSMRERGMTALSKLAIPWFLKRMGANPAEGVPTTTTPEVGEAPSSSSATAPSSGTTGEGSTARAGNTETTSLTDSISVEQKVMLADNIVEWLKTLPPEAMAKMKDAIPEEHYAPLELLSTMVKGA